MKAINLIFVCLILISLSLCKKYPGDIPDEADYDKPLDVYYFTEKVKEGKRKRIWSSNGELQTETITTSDDVITRHYEKGELFSERKYSELIKEKDKKPEMPKRPPNIPKSTFFSTGIGGWVEQNRMKANGVILWKLWWDSGERMGYCKFERSEYNGKCRYFMPSNGILYSEVTFKNGFNVNNETFASTDIIRKLSKEDQSEITILSDTEPKLDEIWDSL